MKIWKFPLQIRDCQDITAPIGMKPVSVQLQHGVPCLWAMVDAAKPNVRHGVWMHGTGHEVAAGMSHEHFVDTFQLAVNGHTLVFHVFCDPVV